LHPRTVKGVHKSIVEPFEWNGYHLTSGDISRLLRVDLKTVHNWVSRGHIQGRRTEGRHLRFARPEVVRFLRGAGYVVPEFLGNAPARLLLDVNGRGSSPLARALAKGCDVSQCSGLFACSLIVAAGQHEVLVLDLDAYPPRLVEDFVHALRAWTISEQLCLVGIASRPGAQRHFLKAGGDATLDAGDSQLRQVVRWLVGAVEGRPKGVQFRGESREAAQ
jgi:excisionase family DNA binding protein